MRKNERFLSLGRSKAAGKMKSNSQGSVRFIRRPATRHGLLMVIVAIGACAFFETGCRSPGVARKPAGNAVASVEIRGNTPGQISSVTEQVFSSKGYQLSQPGLDKMVFEKKGSTFQTLAYGDWPGDVPIWIRVKVSIVPAGDSAFLLECKVFRVSDKGYAIEEEIPISSGGHYQDLLDEVAARFRAPGPNPA